LIQRFFSGKQAPDQGNIGWGGRAQGAPELRVAALLGRAGVGHAGNTCSIRRTSISQRLRASGVNFLTPINVRFFGAKAIVQVTDLLA